MHCPQFSSCTIRLRGDYCPNTDKDRFNQLINSDGHFFPDNFNQVKICSGEVMQHVERLAEHRFGRDRANELPVPTNLIALASEEHPIEVRTLDLRACYAAIWDMPDGWVIQISDSISPPRKRFTLFHEAFHIIAHNRCQKPIFKQRGGNQASFNELLADYFAMCVLMPKEQVREQWLEMRDVDRMSIAFDVPKSTMWLRLKELDLID
jgi:predicted transcriptional regulator